MTTKVESSVEVSRIRNKIGVESVAIRGQKLVVDIDPFFSRSVLSHVDTWHENLRLYDIDFEDERLIFEV